MARLMALVGTMLAVIASAFGLRGLCGAPMSPGSAVGRQAVSAFRLVSRRVGVFSGWGSCVYRARGTQKACFA